ncbi:hypothetical protein [Mesorhizobium sp. WSM2239]|uniref:Uncharacterized protein n=2 Tax=unclassified Mesorhizobium TaxID=325217 RepID=A0AAU8D8X9_9HYPH
MTHDNDNRAPTIAAFTIGGKSDQPLTAEALKITMRNAMARFTEGFGRLPDDAEADMLWASVQRHHGVPEHQIEPASQRRQ